LVRGAQQLAEDVVVDRDRETRDMDTCTPLKLATVRMGAPMAPCISQPPPRFFMMALMELSRWP
jgi:hypothetical protein